MEGGHAARAVPVGSLCFVRAGSLLFLRSKGTAGRLRLLQHRQTHGETPGDYLHRRPAKTQAL